jgi:glycerol uptake facilitator-like aquaporin
MATAMLLMVIFSCLRSAPMAIPYAVGLVITANYWATSSTSFANPAVTIARTITDTFTSIRPVDAAAFIAVQLAAAVAAVYLARWLYADPPKS